MQVAWGATVNRGAFVINNADLVGRAHGHTLSIHDVSVVGIPDDVMGEKIRALIILRDDYKPAATDAGEFQGRQASHQPPTAMQIKKFVRESGLSRFAVPDVVEFVDEFPLTGVGKVSKKDQ